MITLMLALAPLFLTAQNPPHPNGGNAPGSGNTPVGGGAPIDGGITLLMLLGAAYGSRKVYRMKK
ncbi:MAG: hypothetical protein Kow00127_22270 [Bacteroidales bacterium]